MIKRTTFLIFIFISCCFLNLSCQNKRIYEIQGTGKSSPYHGNVITTVGIVSADFQEATALKGFFIQDTTGDNNPATSDGIFVYDSLSGIEVENGDLVEVSGEVDEFFGLSVITNITSITILDSGYSVTPVPISLPIISVDSFERYEGMLVSLKQPLVVTENYNLGRYGELMLSAGGRLQNPTGIIDPNDNPASGTSSSGTGNVNAIMDQKALNERSRIILNDGSSISNPDPVPYLDSLPKTLRCGSILDSLTGVLSFNAGLWGIHPTMAPSFQYAERPVIPALNNAQIKIASFNVLNYFNGDGTGGGFPTARGASTHAEFMRQRTKIIAALAAIDADIVGVMEMENDGDQSNSAIVDLVNGLNNYIGSSTYDFISDPKGNFGNTGSDAIKVAIIYKPDSVTPVDSSMADTSSVHSRPPLAQTFVTNAAQEKFSIVVNHFKSKGCSGATGLNEDQNDGQGCYNYKRKLQAGALLRFIETLQTISGDDDVLVIGDLNAYREEDPIDTLSNYGLVHLDSREYSYVFNGETGSLDHAFSTPSLHPHITKTVVWHINADEPRILDYNQEYNPPGLYNTSPFRSSDHDPLIIGLKFSATNIENLHDTGMKIFPNPTNDQITILLPSNANYDLEIFDAAGNRLSRNKTSGKKTVLNLTPLSKGIYLLQSYSADLNRTFIKKLIVR